MHRMRVIHRYGPGIWPSSRKLDRLNWVSNTIVRTFWVSRSITRLRNSLFGEERLTSLWTMKLLLNICFKGIKSSASRIVQDIYNSGNCIVLYCIVLGQSHLFPCMFNVSPRLFLQVCFTPKGLSTQAKPCRRMASSGIFRRVTLMRTDVSEEFTPPSRWQESVN
jgi:hypothetical protein